MDQGSNNLISKELKMNGNCDDEAGDGNKDYNIVLHLENDGDDQAMRRQRDKRMLAGKKRSGKQQPREKEEFLKSEGQDDGENKSRRESPIKINIE